MASIKEHTKNGKYDFIQRNPMKRVDSPRVRIVCSPRNTALALASPVASVVNRGHLLTSLS